MKSKITVRSVETVKPAARDVIVWDTEVPGFGLKVTPKGRRSYFLYYRTKEGQQRRPAIGLHGAIKPEQAREIAKTMLAQVALGRDPALNRSDTRSSPSVQELCHRYLTDYASSRKKASSIAEDQRLISKIVIPRLGKMKVVLVQRSDIVKLHTALADTPTTANRVIALLSTMFNQAERWAVRPDGSNPAKNIEKFKERKRDRYLTPEEFGRLAAALDEYAGSVASSASVVLAIRLLVFTGARLSEIRSLRWKHVDLAHRVLRLPESKTGAKIIYLSARAVELLQEARELAPSDAEFVCAGRRAGRCLVNLQKPWRRIRASAALDDVRIHDLRHSYASLGVQAGMSLPMLGKLLGHKDVATTARYAHLADDPVRKSSESISEQLMSAFDAFAAKVG